MRIFCISFPGLTSPTSWPLSSDTLFTHGGVYEHCKWLVLRFTHLVNVPRVLPDGATVAVITAWLPPRPMNHRISWMMMIDQGHICSVSSLLIKTWQGFLLLILAWEAETCSWTRVRVGGAICKNRNINNGDGSGSNNSNTVCTDTGRRWHKLITVIIVIIISNYSRVEQQQKVVCSSSCRFRPNSSGEGNNK